MNTTNANRIETFITNSQKTSTWSLIKTGYMDTLFNITDWGLAHPRAYLATALLINAATITAGAAVGDWSLTGALKFWAVATLTALAISTPAFKLAMRMTT